MSSAATAAGEGAPPAERRTHGWTAGRDTLRRITEPAPSGLPRWPVQWWFPALLLLVLIPAVALDISGSSAGVLWNVVGSGPDPNLLAGVPRAVRSDEWLTQLTWIVSQAHQGYPDINQTVPGGMDVTVLLGLPAWDWSTVFRPDAAGFLFLGLDRGLALRWWLPGFVMTVAAYSMLIVLLPRRPATCCALALAVFFSPLIQWWYLPSITWPTALCFLAIATTLISLREQRRWARISWAVATGYVGVCAVLTFYPPFLIPAVLVAVAICVAAIAGETRLGRPGPSAHLDQPTGTRPAADPKPSADSERRTVSQEQPSMKDRPAGDIRLRLGPALVRLTPLVISTVVAVGVLVSFFTSHADTIAAITNTVYPGRRLQATGAAGSTDLASVFGALFTSGFDTAHGYHGLLGENTSEASAPILLGVFLLFPLAYYVIRDWVNDRRIQWMMLACLAGHGLLFAFLLIPGWDVLAHLIALDRTTIDRCRIGFGLFSVIAVGLLARRIDEGDARVPWWLSGVSVAAAAASILLIHSALVDNQDSALDGPNQLWPIAVVFVASILLFIRGFPGPASLALLLVSMTLAVGVNPLYRGAVDLSETALGSEVQLINRQGPGTWLAISSMELSSVLVESGLPSYNGVQLYPSRQMWRDVDPAGRYEAEWNRYASMIWVPGIGEPSLTNSQPDVVTSTFDSCSDFAQQHVRYLLADREVGQGCLQQIATGQQGPTRYWIYRVVAIP